MLRPQGSRCDWSTFCFLLFIFLLWYWPCSHLSWLFGVVVAVAVVGGIYCRRVAVCLAMAGTVAI